MPRAIRVKAIGNPRKMTKMKMPSIRRAICGSVMDLFRSGRCPARPVGRCRSLRDRVEDVLDRLLREGDLGLLDILGGAEPLTGADADDAAEYLRDPLNDEENAGGDEHRLELEDRYAGGAVDAHFHVAPRPGGVFPAGEDEGEDTGEEEEEIENQLD